MVPIAAASFAVGVVVGLLMLQRIDVGETWEEWRDMRVGGGFAVAQVVLIAMIFLGIVFTGELAAALFGVPAGACTVFFLFGANRWRHRQREGFVNDPDEPTSWRETLALGVVGAVAFPLVALLFGVRGADLAYAALAGFVLCALYNWWSDKVENWGRRRGL